MLKGEKKNSKPSKPLGAKETFLKFGCECVEQ